MEAKLIKENNFYKLIQNNTILVKISTNESINIHYSFGKLSLKNCEAIERGYDLDGLADKYEYVNYKGKSKSYNIGFKHGFQKALEILGDKKFSDEDVKRAFEMGEDFGSLPFSSYTTSKRLNKKEYIQSIQQTEWDVIIEMEDVFVHSPSLSPNQKSQWEKKPKLDAENCLILKRK